MEYLKKYNEVKFRNCAKIGDLDSVIKYVEGGMSVDCVGEKNKTALMKAAMYNKLKVVEYLVSKGANVDIRDSNFGKSARDLAQLNNAKDCLNYLDYINNNNNNNNNNTVFVQNNNFVQALALPKSVSFTSENLLNASESGDLNRIIQCFNEGVDLNYAREDGNTAVMFASYIGNLPIVEYLVNNGAIIDKQNAKKRTALFVAAMFGNLSVVQYLAQKGANLSLQDEDFMTPKDIAKAKEMIDVFNFLNSFELAPSDNSDYMIKSKPIIKPSNKVRVLYDFSPMEDNQIEIKVGQIINVTPNNWDDWSTGEEIGTGKIGIFPSSYVEFVEVKLLIDCTTEELSIILLNDNCSSELIEKFRNNCRNGKQFSHCENWEDIKESFNTNNMQSKMLYKDYLLDWKKNGILLDSLKLIVTSKEIKQETNETSNESSKNIYYPFKADNKEIYDIKPLIKKNSTVPNMYTGYIVAFGNIKHNVVVKAHCNERDIKKESEIYDYLIKNSNGNETGCLTMYGFDLNALPSYIVLEKVNCDLTTYFSNRLSSEMRRELFKNIIFAFQNFHALGLAHLDVKPENLGVNHDEFHNVFVKILDLDSVCFILDNSFYPNRNGSLKYTDDWTAPEIFNGEGGKLKASFAMDIFCLGLIGNLLCSDNLTADKTNFSSPELFHKAMKYPSYLKSLITCDKATNDHRELIQSMCSYNEHERPTINEVSRKLNNSSYTKFAENKSITETIISKVTELNLDLKSELDDIRTEIKENHAIILESLDKLSELTLHNFENLNESLLNMNSINQVERKNQKEIFDKVLSMLNEQKNQIKNNDDSNIVNNMNQISSVISGLNSNEISSSIQPLLLNMNSKNSSENIDDKLNVLISMMQNMNCKIDAIDININNLTSLTTSMEMKGNMMPITFIFKPKPERNKLDASASSLSKLKNFAVRKISSMKKLAWDKSLLIFICPVTGKEVPCGPIRESTGKREGYEMSINTQLLKTLAPAFKWGLMFLRVAVSTTSGIKIPQIDGLLNNEIEDYINTMSMNICNSFNEKFSENVSHISDDLNARVDALVNNDNSDSLKYVYEFIKQQEIGAANITSWKPSFEWCGLKLVENAGIDGKSMWVSEEGLRMLKEEM